MKKIILTLSLLTLSSLAAFGSEATTKICGVLMQLQDSRYAVAGTDISETIDDLRSETCTVKVCLIKEGLAVVCQKENKDPYALIWKLKQ